MTVSEFVEWFRDIEIYCKFQKEHNLKRNATPNSKVVQKSAGSDYYRCSSSRPPPESEQKKRAKTSRGAKCLARITVQFPLAYKRTEPNEMNVDKFGDVTVRVKYKNDHTDPVYTRAAFNTSTISKQAKKVEELMNRGFDWNAFKAAVAERRLSFPEPETWSMELFKLQSYHLGYHERKELNSRAVRHKDLDLSLLAWVNDIVSAGGMASLSTEFKDIDPKPNGRKRASSLQNRWSFVFMTKWQQGLLKQFGQVVFLGATHRTCHGFKREDQPQLFTLMVKNQNTGNGAPVAHMITESGEASVIADFLEKVKVFANFKPSQVVINCSLAETKALSAVWGNDFALLWCHWHIGVAFRKRLGDIKTSYDGSDAEHIRDQVRLDFRAS